jgi:phosphatidylglycerol lysyltransferase
MRRRRYPVWLVGLLTLGSGIANTFSVIGPGLPRRMAVLHRFFPIEFTHLSRFATLLIGFALTVSSLNILKSKKRAFQIVLALSMFSAVFHTTKGLDYDDALLSLLLVVFLFVFRKEFTVKSSIPSLRWGALRIALTVTLTTAYGVLGFWLLDESEFGVNFHYREAIRETFRFLSLKGDPTIVAHTLYARWFLDSLSLVTIVALGYSLFAFFRPVHYIYRTLPRERETAESILERYGRHSIDYFKLWPDKSYFFNRSRSAFLAYRVGKNFAVVLADPVGPEREIEGIVREFKMTCDEDDWGLAFYQTLPDFLPVYEKLGFHKLKIGDDAVVDLNQFSLEGPRGREFRSAIKKIEAAGYHIAHYEPPIPDEVLEQAGEVSDDWLRIAGKRERGFTLGRFEPDYVRSTRIFAAVKEDGRLDGFVNIIRCYREGQSTVDLMRRRSDSPNGIMDYLFAKLFLRLKEEGFTTFGMGMAPMAGFQSGEDPSAEERAIHYFFQHMNFVFSYRGLRAYKAKFASYWEPRYVIYQNAFDLPRNALALNAVTKL